MKYRSIFISDTHLATKGCKSKILNSFLKNNDSENLYLVGDIIDGWRIKRGFYWPQDHSNVVRKILGKAKRGTNVIYIAGNHDEFLRKFMDTELNVGNIKIVDQCDHVGIDGNRYLVMHGDYFDGITRLSKHIVFLGDSAYTVLLEINNWYNKLRSWRGLPYWSLSKAIKANVKQGLDFIFEFKKNFVRHARSKGYDGVICGHIHTPEIENIDGMIYMNDGDWVESCTALVEHFDGRWEIVHWKEHQ